MNPKIAIMRMPMIMKTDICPFLSIRQKKRKRIYKYLAYQTRQRPKTIIFLIIQQD